MDSSQIETRFAATMRLIREEFQRELKFFFTHRIDATKKYLESVGITLDKHNDIKKWNERFWSEKY